MASKYTEFELATAIEALWKIVCENANAMIVESLKDEHPVIKEIDEFGAHGPVGIGLGRYGGHAVD